MSTNYYLVKDACPRCGHGRRIHIGTYKFGWCFALHLHPQDGINKLSDWKSLFYEWQIQDEHGDIISPGHMINLIQDTNCSPNVPLRHNGALCVSHGAGAWDNLVGDFE